MKESEGRELNVTFTTSGSGSTTSRLAIPITDLRDMGVTPENRKVIYSYDKDKKEIVIKAK